MHWFGCWGGRDILDHVICQQLEGFTTSRPLCATFISIILKKCHVVWYEEHPRVASGDQSLTQWNLWSGGETSHKPLKQALSVTLITHYTVYTTAPSIYIHFHLLIQGQVKICRCVLHQQHFFLACKDKCWKYLCITLHATLLMNHTK